MGNFQADIADRTRLAVLEDAVRLNVRSTGQIFWVVEDSDDDFNLIAQRYGNKNVFTTLNAAYAAVTSNRNDMILMSAHNTHTLTEGLAWTKNRVHVIGLDGGDRLVQQGTKVVTAADEGDAFVIKVTGVRNTFRNIKFIQNSTDAAALTVAQMGGEGNAYINCSFTFGVVDNLDQTNAFEVVCGEDSGTFIDCEFGSDTLLTSAARAVMSIDQVTSSQEFKSNKFRNCNFLISSSSSTATFIRLAAVGDILFANNFEDCSFTASVDSAGGAALAEAVQTGTSTVKGTLNFGYPRAYAVTNFCTATSGRNTNVFVIGSVVTPEAKTDLVAVTPVAT